MTFPAGLTVIQVTGLHVTDFAGAPLTGYVTFTASALLAVPADDVVAFGSAETLVVNGVMQPVTIPTTDSTAVPFTYTITLRLQDQDNSPPPYAGVLIPHSLGASVDLSALV
jgi:hypothetical protein